MKSFYVLFFVAFSIITNAQNKPLPFYEISDPPAKYTAGTVAARVIDGLGFRFYWATDSLREEDLNYKPGADARTSLQTIEHIYEMSVMITNITTHTVNDISQFKKLSFADMRKQVLENLKTASDNLSKAGDEELEKFTVSFNRADGKLVEYPFWNMINGPVEDCVWHVGQIVSMRRASGNPFKENVSLFSGKVIK